MGREGINIGRDRHIEDFLKEQEERTKTKIVSLMDFIKKEIRETKKKRNRHSKKSNRHTKLFFRERKLEGILIKLGNILEE